MGCGLSKFDKDESDVKFVRPRNEAPIVNDQDEFAEIEQCSNNNGRKSLSVDRGFLKKVFGNASEKGGEKDAEGEQGGRRSISSNSPMIMKNGLFEKESGTSFRESSRSENLTERVSVDMRFSMEMTIEEARRISIEVSVKEAEKINSEMAKEQEKMNYHTNSTSDEAKMPGREENLRENSLLFPPGSPSFRIYCVIDRDGKGNSEDCEQETPGSKLPPTGKVKTTKRRRRTSLLRTVLNRGGSATAVKNV